LPVVRGILEPERQGVPATAPRRAEAPEIVAHD
jgi:hypothetical protein